MLDAASKVPLYQQLAERLCRAIDEGQYEVGARLPSEHELAARYRIGRPTVRQATEVLVRRGRLQRRRGAGTFVTEPPAELDAFSMAGTLAAFRAQGVTVRARQLHPPRTTVIADDAEHPMAGRRVHVLSRVSRTDEGAALLEESWLDAEVFAKLPPLSRYGGSLARLLREHYGAEPTGGEQRLSVARVEGERARALELPERAPVLCVQRTLDFAAGAAAVYAELYHRTDRVVLHQRIGPFGG